MPHLLPAIAQRRVYQHPLWLDYDRAFEKTLIVCYD